MTRGAAASFALVAFAVSGCVGATPRADFEAEVRERGGGITGAQFESIAASTAEQVAVANVDELELLTMRANAVNRIVVVQARRGDQPDFLDTLTFRSDELLAVEPVQDADRFDLDTLAVPITELPLDDAEELVDEAVRAFGDPDTLVAAFSLEQRAGVPVIVVDVESSRRSGEVVFGLDGSIREENDE